jgi:hypothetical protein
VDYLSCFGFDGQPENVPRNSTGNDSEKFSLTKFVGAESEQPGVDLMNFYKARIYIMF